MCNSKNGYRLVAYDCLVEFSRSTHGNVFMIFGLMLLAICGVAGLAVDYSRANDTRTRLQGAVDAAAIAAKASGETSSQAIKLIAQSYFEKNWKPRDDVSIGGLEVKLDDATISVSVSAKMKTTLAAAIGYDILDLNVSSEATSSTEDLEIAIVLDNTGSMEDHMDELKTGAADLVKTVFDNAANKSKLKMAVVPYVGAVNVGNEAGHLDWMDTGGDAVHHGGTLEWMYFGYEPGCTYTPGSGGSPVDPGSGTHGALDSEHPTFAKILQSAFGIASAEAAAASDVPAPFNFAPDCWIGSPSRINYFDLFAKVPNTSWKGCVEARAEPYDVTDEVPSKSNADTLFVPWFWPDETDHSALAAEGAAWRTANDYLPDRLDLRNAVAPKFTDTWSGWGINNILKYNGSDGVIDEIGPDTSGPNKSCPDPILPLTNDQTELLNKIEGLTHWHGSGTNVAEGLAWGWRVLSPQEPFTEGAAYGKTKKAIVLMTDGVNNVDPVDSGFDRLSHMSAYGYLQQWGYNRIEPKTYDAFKQKANSRLELICENAKAEGITVYTVAFGIADDETLEILQECASQPTYAYSASTSGDLIAAFQKIASRLSELRLVK